MKSVSNAHKVHKFAVLDNDLSIAGWETRLPLKLKPYVIVQKYVNQIDALYNHVLKK